MRENYTAAAKTFTALLTTEVFTIGDINTGKKSAARGKPASGLEIYVYRTYCSTACTQLWRRSFWV
jgi:hypothetical protein